MDPVSQGALGATLAQAATGRKSSTDRIKAATWLGCLAGLAPDLDVLIASPTDPMLFLEFHRQFTHSLFFIPIGALVVAAVMYRFFRKHLSFTEAYLFCLAGYATHGLLDACTTYGTQLLWPFSNERFAWNSVSIIDPLFTLTILVLVIVGVLRSNPWFGRVALIWGMTYLAFGVVQRDRAMAVGHSLAASRGHDPVRLEAKPGFGNLILWKIVYETEDRFYVDAARVTLDQQVYEGESAVKLDLVSHFPWLAPDSQQAIDVERFRWFSNNYLALDPVHPNRIIDVRYSVVPNEVEALWAIDLNPQKSATDHVTWQALRRTSSAQTTKLVQMVMGRSVAPAG